MSLPGKSMLISMGIFIGLIFAGINICLANYNSLVVPDPPLKLFEWRVTGEGVEINLLGDEHKLQLPPGFGDRCGTLFQTFRGEMTKWLDDARQRVREWVKSPPGAAREQNRAGVSGIKFQP